MKIVILDGFTENPGDLSWEPIEKYGDLTVYDRTPADQIVERISDADYIYTNKTPLTAETLEQCKNLKFIGVLATGYNVVDTNAAKKQGITVCNIPTYGTDAVAQFVFALLLEICHHVGEHSNAVKKGDWASCPDFCFWNYPLIELRGKTMGLIGYGRIGKTVGSIAASFGMNVFAYDTHATAENNNVVLVDLPTLLASSDVISLHCPLFPETEKMINQNTIAQMKDGVILINTSRGPLIHEQDLADALNSGKVFAAAVDVVSQEPISENNPLLQAKNVFITPHIAWAPKEARQRLMNIAGENLGQYIEGTPINVV